MYESRPLTAAILLAATTAPAALASNHDALDRPALDLARYQPSDDPAELSGAESAAAAALDAEDNAEAGPTDPGFLKGWSGEITLGINGAEGNTQNFNFRLGAMAEKETENWLFTNQLTYNNAQDDGDESEDRLRLGFRQERKFVESPWSAFLQEEYVYDEFDSFLHRIGFFAGAGYVVHEDDKQLLKAIGGLGGRYDTGNGADPGVTPEAFVGAEYERQLTERQSFNADSTVFFAIDGENDVRNVTNAGWEIIVDDESNLALEAGIRNEYDTSARAPTRKNDFEYFILLVYKY